MVEGQAKAGTVIEPVGQLHAGTEFDSMAKILAVSVAIQANRKVRRQDPAFTEENVEAEP